MAGIVSTDQWSIREKLCLASSVIRSGDQNWVSVSRAIKPFGEAGRPPDWFSQKNCACQYSALLETVETPKRKRNERGEGVDTPGDLIVRKMTKERIAELKAQLEEDKARYRQLQREIEQIRSGQLDEKLQTMWDEIQEQKQAAKEAEEAQKAAAETAKAAAAVKPGSKIGFQSPNKRRPQAKTPRVGSRSQSETSSQGDSLEVEDSALTSPIKVTAEESISGPEDSDAKKPENSTSAILTSLTAAEEQQEQDATTNQEEEVPADTDAEETAERLLAATASDLVELLSPYPEDSPSSQSIDESSQPAQDSSTPAPRVKEPLILKIEKGVVKSREPKVETQVSKSEECPENEMINVDQPENDQQPTDPQASSGDANAMKILTSPKAAHQQAGSCSEIPRPSQAGELSSPSKTSNAMETVTIERAAASDDPVTKPRPPQQVTPNQKIRSPTGRSLSPEEQKVITQKLDAALYNEIRESEDTPSPRRWLRSLQDRKKTSLRERKTPVKTQESRVQSEVDQPSDIPKKVKSETPSPNHSRAAKPKMAVDKETPTKEQDPLPDQETHNKTEPTPQAETIPPTVSAVSVDKSDQCKATHEPTITSAGERSPREIASPSNDASEADKSVDITPVTKPRADPEDDDYHHIEPASPEDSSSRDDADVVKVKRRGMKGRPSGSQRKSSRIRNYAAAEEEEDHSQPATPSGRRSAGKDGTASSIASLIGDDSKEDTHSEDEGEDSDATDKPSESDREDLSASAGALQSSFFLDSLPNSPASVAHSEEDHAYKIWRKAIMLVWRAIASHKYANVFLHPVTEDIAPGYKSIVHRPIDLITIKKNIENGAIRTTEQFHRDMMLMFQNAIMYNNADQHVHQIATIMQADVVKQIEEFVSTQLLVQQPDSTKMLRGRGKQGQGEEDRSRRSSTDTDTSGKKRRTRADEY